MVTEPLSFDFITDRDLRTSLDSDYHELHACLDASAWKAVHVLSGSIVEALLVDYLIGIGYSTKNPLNMTLEDLIGAAQSAGALSQRAADLSSVVRGYRNLIHPGRVVRLDEEITEEGASIANSLVAMIVREIANKQAQVHGLTSDQLLAKFEGDPSALAISDHLLREARPGEVELLMTEKLPERYVTLAASDFLEDGGSALETLRRVYFDGFEMVDDSVKTKVAKRYVDVLREDAGWRVDIYEQFLFVGHFLEYLSDAERSIVKTHFFSRVDRAEISEELIACFSGFGGYLKNAEVHQFFNPLIRTVAYSGSKDLQRLAGERIKSEYAEELSEAHKKVLNRWLNTWERFMADEKERPYSAERIAEIAAALDEGDALPT